MTKELKTVIALRRDTDQAFALIKDTFTPIKGEVVLIDTLEGLRVKVGDGENTLSTLPYIDAPIYDEINSVVIQGYYLKSTDKFYKDTTYTTYYEGHPNKIYIDKNTHLLYHSTGVHYYSINDTLPSASDLVAGIMKLYSEKGQNTDGTMSQKIITDSLNTKIEASVDTEKEMAIFSITL